MKRKEIQMRKEIKFILFLLLPPLLLYLSLAILVNVFINQPRPLLPTWQWQVKSATHSGKPVSVKIYKMLGRDVFFFRACGGHDTPLKAGDSPYPRWFMMDFENDKNRWYATDDGVHVFKVNPGIFPYLSYPVDKLQKIPILDGKIEELWYLSYTGDTVVFSNKVFFVSATQKNSKREPVSVHRRTWEPRHEERKERSRHEN